MFAHFTSHCAFHFSSEAQLPLGWKVFPYTGLIFGSHQKAIGQKVLERLMYGDRNAVVVVNVPGFQNFSHKILVLQPFRVGDCKVTNQGQKGDVHDRLSGNSVGLVVGDVGILCKESASAV